MIKLCFFLYLPESSPVSTRNMHFFSNKDANKIIYIFQIPSQMIYLSPKCQDLMPFPFKHYQIISHFSRVAYTLQLFHD